MDKVRIFALGGLDEDGKNMYVVEVNEAIFIIEAGLKYPDTDQLGVEFIIPDFTYLIENKDRIQVSLLHMHMTMSLRRCHIFKTNQHPCLYRTINCEHHS